METMNLAIPAAIATASAISFQSSELHTRDSLFCQIALLLGLMLYHNLLMIEASRLQQSNGYHTNSTSFQNTSLTNIKMSEGALDVIGHCYVTTIIALFATLTCRGQNYEYSHKMRYSPYSAKHKFSHPLNLAKLATASVVPASLTFVYMCLLVQFLGKNELEENESTFYEDKHRGIYISKHDMSLVVFVLIWVSIMYCKTRRRQNKPFQIHNPALVPQTSIFNFLSRICSTKTNEFDHDLSLNEKDWESWTNSDLIAWVKLLYKKQTQTLDSMTGLNGYKNDYRNKPQRDVAHGGVQIEIDDEVLLQTLTILREQMINGSVLPHIQVNDLVAMGIKFSYSIFLHVRIQKLIHSEPRNMNPYERDSESGDGIDLEKWLGKKIGGSYEKSISHSDSDQESDSEEYHNESKIPQHAGLHDPTSLPQVSGANDIMSARFGVELPELKVPPGIDMKQSSTPIPRVNATAAGKKSALKPQSTKSASQTIPSLDPNFLQSMPPNIREIASRNPELVKALHDKFLFEKNQAFEAQNVTSTREKMVRFQMDGGDNDVVQSEGLNDYDEEAGEFENSNYDNKNMNDFDDEMVGLLRRRSTNQRLKSG